MNIDIEINAVRNIKFAELSLPYERGLYALVGENGCGKSTLMLALSLMVKTSSAKFITTEDLTNDSSIIIRVGSSEDIWKKTKNGKFSTGKYRPKGKSHQMIASTHCHGFYEGSIFYGCRFDDYANIDAFYEKKNYEQYLKPADQFVIQTLGYIMHNDKTFYNGLLKIKSRDVAAQLGFSGVPYFQKINNNIISQFRMSSGESMLISLIDFINNLVVKGAYDKLLFLIDEVELALHPGAIDRLLTFLNNLIRNNTTELVIYFSTHSSELLERISPKNIFMIENNSGVIDCINPCYPNYAVRNLYVPNGFDFLILVEDALAKAFVDKLIRDNMLGESKLCCVLPAGGWSQMLRLHHDMVTYNALGVGKHIISIYDGDAKNDVNKKKEYSNLPKCFLPIQCIEKFLKSKCIDNTDRLFIKRVGDKYFTQRSINDIIHDYANDDRTKKSGDKDGKIFYNILLSNLEKIGMQETDFVKHICDDICETIDVSQFVETLRHLLE